LRDVQIGRVVSIDVKAIVDFLNYDWYQLHVDLLEVAVYLSEELVAIRAVLIHIVLFNSDSVGLGAVRAGEFEGEVC